MDVPRGTVGCVVRDGAGRLAAATSTGGAPYARAGRVGDSPIPGAGYFADAHGAASSTGWGEAILTTQLAARSVHAVESGQAPEDGASGAIRDLRDRIRWPGASPATGGLLLIDAQGRAGWAHSTPRMARGWWRPGAEVGATLDR